MANKETRIYKSDTLETFRQKSNEVSLHVGDNEQLSTNLKDKTYNYDNAGSNVSIFKGSDDNSKTLRFEIKPDETLDNTAGYIILNDVSSITGFDKDDTLTQSGGYSATVVSSATDKILVKNSSGTFNAAQDISDGTNTIAAANIDRIIAESYNVGVLRVYKNGTEISQNMSDTGFHVLSYAGNISLSNTPDVSEFTEGSTVYQNGSQITTSIADVQANSNWYGVVLRATSTELLIKSWSNVGSSFSASAMIRLFGANDTIAANDHGALTEINTSYGNAIELNTPLANSTDDIKIFSMDVVAALNELQDDIGVTENLTTTATNLVNAVNEIEAVFDASTHEISAGGNNFNVTSGVFTLDSTGDIILDADGADVILKDGGSEYGRLTNSSGQLQLQSNGSNVVLTANDTNATFNNNLVVEGTLDSDGDFEVGASKFNVVAASGNTQIDGTLDVDGVATLDTNTTVGGTLGVTGATTLSSTLAVTGVGSFSTAVGIDGNFDINTDKFTVAASSGNTVIAGTLNIGSLNTAASDVRGAINEHEADIGTVGNLTTTATSLVTAINELDLKQGAAALSTTATTLSGAINELVSEKVDLASDTEQTINSDIAFSNGKTFTFPSGSTLAIESGAALTIAGSATGVSTFGVDYLEVDGNQTATGMGLQVARDHIAGAPAVDPKIQWRESRVTAGDPEKAWQVVGLDSTGSNAQEQDLVTFYNAYHLIANNDENGINVAWDSTNQNFDFNVDDFTVTLGTGPISGSFTVTDLGNATFNTTLDNNSVALGTKTTGNYIATIAGTSNEIEVTGSGSETAAVTIGLPNAVDIVDLDVTATTNSTSSTTGALTVAGGMGVANDVYIGGDLVVQGDTVTLNTETLTVEDTLVLAGNNLSSEPSSGGFGLEVGPIPSTPPSGVASGVTGAHSIVYNYATDQWEADGSLILSNATNTPSKVENTDFGAGKDLVFSAGSGLSEAVTGLSGNTFTVTYTNTDKGSDVMVFKNVASDSGTAVADTNTDTLTISGGTFIDTSVSGDTLTINHSDTSSQASVDNSGGSVIQDVTLDSRGHITGLNSINLDGRYYQESEFTSANTASKPVIRDGSGNFSAGTVTANLTGNVTGTVSGNAGSATQVYVNSTSANSDFRLIYGEANDGGNGNETIYKDNTGGATYNPSSGRLTAASFGGNGAALTSLAAGNISTGTISDARLPASISSDITGNAASATQVYVTENNSENASLRVLFHDGANSGNTGLEHDDSLLYNPSTNTLTATTFSGNASTATKLATARTIAVGGAVTGSASFDGSANITISTTATSDPTLTLSGDLSGNATFTNLGDATLSATIVNGSVATAMLADDAVTGAKIANDTISGANMVHNTLTATHIAANAIGASELADGAVDTNAVSNDAITYAKIQNVSATNRILGRDSSGAGNIEEISPSSLRSMINVADGATNTSNPNNATITLSAGSGLDGGGNFTTDQSSNETISFSIEADLRDGITHIGRDTNDYINIGTTHHSFYLDGALDMKLENDGDLHVRQDVVAFSTTVTSDEKLKENIQVVNGALEKVSQLNGVTFNWKKDGKESAGVIAQNVEEVLPSAVREIESLDGDEMNKHVDYNQLSALFIEAIKELKEENNKIKSELEDLKNINR